MYKFLRCLNCLYYVKKSYSFCIHSFIHPVGHVFHHGTMLPGAMLRLGYMMTITDTVTVLQTVVMSAPAKVHSFASGFLDSWVIAAVMCLLFLISYYYIIVIILIPLYYFYIIFSAILRWTFWKSYLLISVHPKTSGHQNPRIKSVNNFSNTNSLKYLLRENKWYTTWFVNLKYLWSFSSYLH